MGIEQWVAEAEGEGPVRHKLTVDEFLMLDEGGAFANDHVELIDGEILSLSPIYKPHAEALAALTFEMVGEVRRIGGLRCYSPVSTFIDRYNLPQPDLVIAQDDEGDRYVSREAVRLVVEVSAATLRHDLSRKSVLYAGAGIPEYWVFDVESRLFTRFHAPSDDGFAAMHRGAFGERLASVTLPGFAIETASLL